MKKIMIAVAVAATFTSGAAMAQAAGMGFKAGATRDAVVANSAKAFARMDQNGDGSFDVTEATAVLQARATKNGKEFKPAAAAKAISNADADGDGKVTLAEFQAAAGKRFDAADTNKNGTIDAEEAKGGEGE